MVVKDVLGMLFYGTPFEIKGAYSGKVYHKSWVNSKAHAEQFLNRTVLDCEMIYPTFVTQKRDGIGESIRPAVGIWMHDYQETNNDNKQG